MKNIKLATSLIAAAMIASASFTAVAAEPKAPQSMTSTAGSNPEEQQAYNDGVMAAKLDKAAKRKIDATASHLYVKPPVKKDAHEAYRAAFKKGYEATVSGGM